MKVSVVANISIRLPVKNVGTGEEEVVSVPLKVDELVQLDIPDQPTNRFYPFTLQTKRLYISQQIRKRLQDTIIDSITQNLNNDISSLVEAVEDSPPRIITIRDFEDKDWRAYAKQNSTANFQIVSTGEAGNQPLFGQERVWRHTAPVWTNYQDTYFKNDKESGLTCAYEYLMEFSKKNNCKKAGRDKQAIDKYINWKGTKGEVFQQIFNKWFNRNKARFRIQDTSEYHPLPEVVSVGDLYCEWYDIRELDLSTEYSQVDEDKTLNVIDLLKWCIATSTRLNVIDCDGGHYLDYNPEDYVCFYPDLNLKKPTQFKGSILVKIANRHAYFEEHKDKKISYTKRNQKHNNRLEDSSYKKKKKSKGQKEHEEEVKATEFRYIGKYFDEEELKERARKYRQSCEPAIQAGVYTQQEIDKDVEDILDELNFIPPTPEQLVEFMDDKGYKTHYYLGMSNLNGLISYIYKKLNRQPNKLTGRACSINYATFGNLKLYKKAQPYENTNIDVEQLNKLIPKTKNEKGILPTISKIANLIHEQVSDEPDSIWSQFNPQMKRIFYETEIKPDIRKMKGDFKDEDELASYDLKRAYTNCLNNNKYGWCVYDVISQPKNYSGSFRPDWFYICKNKKDAEYPCIRGKGYLLYHGSLLQYCLEQVDIIWEIPPLRQLPIHYFKKFVEEALNVSIQCEWLVYAGIMEPKFNKRLVNQFIGTLKNRDGVKTWDLRLHQDKKAVMRRFLNNETPTKLCDGIAWNTEPILTSSGQLQSYTENAQPIRLQILSMCSEMNYILYKTYTKCLYESYKLKPVLAGVHTDALKIPKTLEHTRAMDDAVDELQTQSGNHRMVVREKDCLYQDLVDTQEQYGIAYRDNKWMLDYSIDKAWNLETDGRAMISLGVRNGGCWYSGLGGRGKTELLKRATTLFDRNRKLYNWVRMASRLMDDIDGYDFRQEWLDENPTTYIKVAPTNKSANLIKGKTLHKQFGLRCEDPDDTDEEDEEEQDDSKRQGYFKNIVNRVKGDKRDNKHPLGVILADEISMVDGKGWGCIQYLREVNPNLVILGFGDIEHQLPPVEPYYRDKYAFNNAYSLKTIFNFNKITLNYNFRVGVSGDDLWEKSMFSKNFPISNQPLTDKNLCFTNAKRKEIITECEDTLVNPVVIEYTPKNEKDPRQTLRYCVGTPMMSLKSFDIEDGIRVAKNEMYKITQLDPLQLTLIVDDEPTEQVIEISKEDLIKKFVSGYCMTIHKSQGETFKYPYTIHELKSIFANKRQGRRLIYTAISRSKNPENNIFYRE